MRVEKVQLPPVERWMQPIVQPTKHTHTQTERERVKVVEVEAKPKTSKPKRKRKKTSNPQAQTHSSQPDKLNAALDYLFTPKEGTA